jgi:hypothetical protein
MIDILGLGRTYALCEHDTVMEDAWKRANAIRFRMYLDSP